MVHVLAFVEEPLERPLGAGTFKDIPESSKYEFTLSQPNRAGQSSVIPAGRS